MPSSVASSPSSAILALQQATHATLGAASRELHDLRLSAAELNVLATLADPPEPRTVTQLAAEVGSRITTVSGVLDRLERGGYVTRRAHPGDRRALRIELTSTGAIAAQRVRTAFDDLERRAFATLSTRTVGGFRRALAALREVSAHG